MFSKGSSNIERDMGLLKKRERKSRRCSPTAGEWTDDDGLGLGLGLGLSAEPNRGRLLVVGCGAALLLLKELRRYAM